MTLSNARACAEDVAKVLTDVLFPAVSLGRARLVRRHGRRLEDFRELLGSRLARTVLTPWQQFCSPPRAEAQGRRRAGRDRGQVVSRRRLRACSARTHESWRSQVKARRVRTLLEGLRS